MSGSPPPPVIDGSLWAVYCTSQLRVDLPGRSVVVTGSDPAPAATRHPDTLVVLTAWNPYGRARAEAANRAAGRYLVTAVEAAGLEWYPAIGRSPDGRWEEEGIAVSVPDRAGGLELGRRWEQLAVYEWSPAGAVLSVVACFEDRITTLHASSADLPPVER